jgi:hypothetical protein
MPLKNVFNIKSKNSNINILFEEERIDEPETIISKTLFNYICFIYAMKTKYNDYSSYFEELYSFIDNYISQHIKTCDLKREWTWLLVYHTKHVSNFNLDKTYNKFKLKNNENNMKTNFELIAYLSKKIKYCNSQEHYFILDIIYKILINVDNLNDIAKSPEYSEQFKKLNRAFNRAKICS